MYRLSDNGVMGGLNNHIKSEYISLTEASEYSGNYSQEYLSLRARQGKLKAVKMGRNWVTKKEWVDNYSKQANNYFKYQHDLSVKSKADKTNKKNVNVSVQVSSLYFDVFKSLSFRKAIPAMAVLLFLATATFGYSSYKEPLNQIISFLETGVVKMKVKLSDIELPSISMSIIPDVPSMIDRKIVSGMSQIVLKLQGAQNYFKRSASQILLTAGDTVEDVKDKIVYVLSVDVPVSKISMPSVELPKLPELPELPEIPVKFMVSEIKDGVIGVGDSVAGQLLFIRQGANNYLSLINNRVGNNWQVIKQIISQGSQNILASMDAFLSSLFSPDFSKVRLPDIDLKLGNRLKILPVAMINGIKGIGGSTKSTLSSSLASVKDINISISQNIIALASSYVDVLNSTKDKIILSIKSTGQGIGGLFSKLANGVKLTVSNIFGSILNTGEYVTSDLNNFKAFSFDFVSGIKKGITVIGRNIKQDAEALTYNIYYNGFQPAYGFITSPWRDDESSLGLTSPDSNKGVGLLPVEPKPEPSATTTDPVIPPIDPIILIKESTSTDAISIDQN